MLRATVVMKTDISGSTPRFRSLLAADLQSLIDEHHALLARCAAGQGGSIVKGAGDGYWLTFPSVTAAARAAIEMQESLRLAQPNRGDDRLAMRIVIALGDLAFHDDDLAGDSLALVARIEAITPPDEIYLSHAARLAAMSAEIRLALVGNFSLKGFDEPVPVFRVEQRHRTQIVDDACILVSDLRGFARVMEGGSVAAIERILDALDGLTQSVAKEFGGVVRYSQGDSHTLTFPGVVPLVGAAVRLREGWAALDPRERSGCSINLALHRGRVFAFRSFLYGEGLQVATHVERASSRLLTPGENGLFLTDAVRCELAGTTWDSRLEPVVLEPVETRFPGRQVYRLAR
jgi:class 3 adenylate cyclase